MLARLSLALTLPLMTLAACGGGGSDTPDASKQIDAAVATVMAVTCPSGTVPTIMTIDTTNAFMPNAVTINVGQVVQFMTSATHNVVPNPPMMTDPGLVVDFRQTKCLMFTKTGTFSFKCAPHGFTGTVTVQ